MEDLQSMMQSAEVAVIKDERSFECAISTSAFNEPNKDGGKFKDALSRLPTTVPNAEGFKDDSLPRIELSVSCLQEGGRSSRIRELMPFAEVEMKKLAPLGKICLISRMFAFSCT